MYEKGLGGLAQSDVEAGRWFTRAAAGFGRLAAQGDDESQLGLGLMYKQGVGGSRRARRKRYAGARRLPRRESRVERPTWR
jgi:TPR repeat protein